MNRITILITGALLAGAPAFSEQTFAADPKAPDGKFEWFQLGEGAEQIRKMAGPPRLVAPFGTDFLSWQYQMAEGDHDDFSHQFVFSRSKGTLISVTRNFEPERVIDEWFPADETMVCHFPDPNHPQYSVRVRRLSGGRLLLAPGDGKPGRPSGQVVIMREPELRVFYPWAADQLAVATR